jgi:hypothetical protein
MHDAYETIYRDFRWQVPPEFNWFEACCARWPVFLNSPMDSCEFGVLSAASD